MYKITMNDVPGDIRRRICEQLDRKGLEFVHMGQKSLFVGENRFFAVIARDIKPRSYCCYFVFTFDSETDELICEEKCLPYPDALIEMGSGIRK